MKKEESQTEITESPETITEEQKETKVLYVGDTLNDILAAKAANVISCGVLYINHPEIMLEAKPDFVINKFSELLRICGE